jgi:type IV pilus assembly protein PilN
MIKINLLEQARRKKRKPLPIFLIIGIILTLIFVVGLLGMSNYLNNKIETLNSDKTSRQDKLKQLEAKLKEVQEFEQKNKALEEKTKAIEALKKNQTGPVKLLDELSQQLPKGVWLTTLAAKANTITLEGTAFTNTALVAYIRNLKQSKELADVSLVESKQIVIQGATVYTFKISFQVKV